VPNLSRITFNEYNTTVNWISSAERANTYFHCANNIGIFYPFPTYCNGLIANLLLYYTTSEMFDSLKVSISSTLYSSLFRMKVLCKAFL
jgi:hypothetical protein